MGTKTFGLLMIALGVVSIILRQKLVRWYYELPRPGAKLTDSQARVRETLQLIGGILLIAFGIAVLIFLS